MKIIGLGRGEPRGRLAHHRRRRQDARGRDRRRTHRLFRRRVEDVLRQADVDRPHRRRRGDLDRAPDGPQQRRGMLDDRRPLGDRTRHRDEVARHLRVHRRVLDAGVAADHDERRVAALRLVQRADAVADAGRAVQLHERGTMRRPRVAIRHQDGDRLLQRQDVLHLRIARQGVQEPLLHRAGVPEHEAHPVREELLDDRMSSGLGRPAGRRSPLGAHGITTRTGAVLFRGPPPFSGRSRTSHGSTGP